MLSLALAAATLGAATVGTLVALHSTGSAIQRRTLAAFYLLVGFLAALPAVAAFLAPVFTLYMPLCLPAMMAIPPTLGTYARELTHSSGGPVSKRGVFSFIPASIGLLVAIGFWVLSPQDRDMMLIRGELPSGWFPSALALTTFGVVVGWSLWSFRDLAIIFSLLREHRKRLKDFYSNTDTRELRWLDAFAAMLTGTWVLLAVSLLADNLVGTPLLAPEALQLIALVLLVFLASWSLRSPLAAGMTTNDADMDIADGPNEDSATKYARSALSDEQAARLALKIESAMATDSLYLDANLSLSKLSRHIGASPNLVSQTLNERIGETFFDYVNGWRVKAAMPRLLEGRASVLEVALAVGFNSRSTFYKAFQRVTGNSPGKYRAERLGKNQ